jgi:hypothetical protein
MQRRKGAPQGGNRANAGVAEITAENLQLKKDLKLEDLSRVPAQSKAEVIRLVKQTKQRSGWPAHRRLRAIEVPVACTKGGCDGRAWRIEPAGPAGSMRSERRSASSR